MNHIELSNQKFATMAEVCGQKWPPCSYIYVISSLPQKQEMVDTKSFHLAWVMGELPSFFTGLGGSVGCAFDW